MDFIGDKRKNSEDLGKIIVTVKRNRNGTTENLKYEYFVVCQTRNCLCTYDGTIEPDPITIDAK